MPLQNHVFFLAVKEFYRECHTLVIEVTDIVKRYGSNTVLNNATFQINEGQLTTILGPSGCGKSTMLRCMNRLEKFDRGRLKIGGVEVLGTEDKKLTPSEEKELTRRLRERVGIIFQNFNLFPHLTALGNCIEAPMTVKGMGRKQAEEIARQYLHKVGLAEKEDHYPAQLSGGQQQRVAIARALAMEPEVILFDEPTSALDPQLIQSVARMLRALDDLGKTLVVVSHDMNFARRISDQVIYFEGGHAVESGTPEEVFGNPKMPETIAFMQSFQDDEIADAPATTVKPESEKLDVNKGTRGNLGQEE
ncbi:MAG TPA: amino acid ABC transporter ATP-binding protein [Pyrinomonadaceae bacterium]